MAAVVPLGPQSTRMMCPHCHTEISTSTKTQPATKAYIAGAIIALFGCILGCCLIPCCMESCKSVQHNCPKCHGYLGKFER